jgi:ATP-dependent protease ClpP protease subunit
MIKTNRYAGSELDRSTQSFPVSSYPNSYTYNIFIQESLQSPEDFIDAIAALGMAGENDKVVLHLNCEGGSLDAVDTLLMAMNTCEGTIHVVGTGIIASAATLILLGADSFELSPYCNLLFHSASFGMGAKSVDVLDYSKFMHDQTEKLMTDFYKGVLTDDEIKDIIYNKKELWMTAKEFSERYAKHMEELKAEALQKPQGGFTKEELEGLSQEELINLILMDEAFEE